jgi:hypothetical protein
VSASANETVKSNAIMETKSRYRVFIVVYSLLITVQFHITSPRLIVS